MTPAGSEDNTFCKRNDSSETSQIRDYSNTNIEIEGEKGQNMINEKQNRTEQNKRQET
jgi:hypothetical protein